MDTIDTHPATCTNTCNPPTTSAFSSSGIEVRVQNVDVRFVVQKALAAIIIERLQRFFILLSPTTVFSNKNSDNVNSTTLSTNEIDASGLGRPLLQDINFHIFPGQGKSLSKKICSFRILFSQPCNNHANSSDQSLMFFICYDRSFSFH